MFVVGDSFSKVRSGVDAAAEFSVKYGNGVLSQRGAPRNAPSARNGDGDDVAEQAARVSAGNGDGETSTLIAPENVPLRSSGRGACVMGGLASADLVVLGRQVQGQLQRWRRAFLPSVASAECRHF